MVRQQENGSGHSVAVESRTRSSESNSDHRRRNRPIVDAPGRQLESAITPRLSTKNATGGSEDLTECSINLVEAA